MSTIDQEWNEHSMTLANQYHAQGMKKELIDFLISEQKSTFYCSQAYSIRSIADAYAAKDEELVRKTITGRTVELSAFTHELTSGNKKVVH